MHKYLRAVGFSDCKKKDMEIILEDVIEQPEYMRVARDSEQREMIEYVKTYAGDAGLVVRGYYNEEDEFEIEYYMPYFRGNTVTTKEIVEVEKHAERESYAGVCDDPNVSLTLIFYINDVAEMLAPYKGDIRKAKFRGARLCGLSVQGKVILPLEPSMQQNSKKTEEHEKLVSKAREGDEDAMEDLSFQEMDMYSVLTKRVRKEDLMTIISTYIMPYGVESDHYGIMGDIMDVRKVQNNLSMEELFILKVKCNSLIFDICINCKDLVGEPLPGRRFKGNIWMLGDVTELN